jgi:hypothetical protein
LSESHEPHVVPSPKSIHISFQHVPESLAESESCGVAKSLFRAWGVQNHDVIRELVFAGARKLHRIRCLGFPMWQLHLVAEWKLLSVPNQAL